MDIHPFAVVMKLVDELTETVEQEKVKSTAHSLRRALEDANLYDLEELREENEALRARLHAFEGATRAVPSDDGCYSMEQFLAILTAKLRRSYGWRTDYIVASQQTLGCQPVNNEMVQKWQTSDRVPAWAVEQIGLLVFPKRVGKNGPPWSDHEEMFLTNLYNQDPTQTNRTLATRCSAHFGRPINENSIKGAVDRLRKRGFLPRKRP